MAGFWTGLHSDLRAPNDERAQMRRAKQELEREKPQLAAEGKKEQQAKIREMEKKLETCFAILNITRARR